MFFINFVLFDKNSEKFGELKKLFYYLLYHTSPDVFLDQFP